jgi:hypothetical protein
MASWVVQTRGKYAGRIGVLQLDLQELNEAALIEHVGPDIRVRFGAGGPVCDLKRSSVRRATRAEIAEKLGCRIQDLPDCVFKEHPE